MAITMTEEEFAAAMLADAKKMCGVESEFRNNGLSEKVRLLLDGPRTVRELAEEMGESDENIRGRLAYLRNKNLARSEREGNRVTWYPA